ncbi:hypothetical protein, partial [Salinispora arenicola]|uniref:hypothetical protein n=1 Tax=Salinispora arenicola TaxID=168697 RepID=UPI0027DAD965
MSTTALSMQPSRLLLGTCLMPRSEQIRAAFEKPHIHATENAWDATDQNAIRPTAVSVYGLKYTGKYMPVDDRGQILPAFPRV